MLPVSLGRSSALHAPLIVVLITQLPSFHCGKEVTVPVEGVWVGGWVGGRRELIIISVCMQYPVPMVARHFLEAKKRYNQTEHMISVRNASDLRSTPCLAFPNSYCPCQHANKSAMDTRTLKVTISCAGGC